MVPNSIINQIDEVVAVIRALEYFMSKLLKTPIIRWIKVLKPLINEHLE